MSQKELIREALIMGRFITPLDALQEFGCFRLGSRIHELRQEGMDIRKMIDKKKHYAKYYLIAPGVRREF